MSNDQISDAARWRTCIHEAGHATMAILTKTPLIRANVYRHYSTAARYDQVGYVLPGPAVDDVRDGMFRAGGLAAEFLLTLQPVKRIVNGCRHDICDGPEIPDDVIDFCMDAVSQLQPEVLHIAHVLFDARGSVPGHLLTAAFRMEPA